MQRREFLVLAGTAALLSGCLSSGPPKPSSVTVNAIGQAGMNPGPSGGDRPVTVLLLRLKSAGKFNSADYFTLQANPSAVLGGDLLGMDRITVAPGGTASKGIAMEPEATTLGFVALVRTPTGRNWRTTLSVSPGSTVTATATLGSAGISVSGG